MGSARSSLPRFSGTAWDFLPFSYAVPSHRLLSRGKLRPTCLSSAFWALTQKTKAFLSVWNWGSFMGWLCSDGSSEVPWRETITSSCKCGKRLESSTPASLRKLLSPSLLYWSYRHNVVTHNFLCGFWGFKHGSPSLHSKCPYPLSRLPNPIYFFFPKIFLDQIFNLIIRKKRA